jgi:hypothetical protein
MDQKDSILVYSLDAEKRLAKWTHRAKACDFLDTLLIVYYFGSGSMLLSEPENPTRSHWNKISKPGEERVWMTDVFLSGWSATLLGGFASEGEDKVEEKCLEEIGWGCVGAGVLVLEGELDLFEEWSRESGMNRDWEWLLK